MAQKLGSLLLMPVMVTLANAQDMHFVPVDGGVDRACRGPGPSDDHSYYTVHDPVRSEEDCKALCENNTACVGIEFGEYFERCEVWTLADGIAMAIPVIGYSCLRYELASTLTTSSTVATTTISTLTTATSTSTPMPLAVTTLTIVDIVVWPTTTTMTTLENATWTTTTFTTVDAVVWPTSTGTFTSTQNLTSTHTHTSTSLLSTTSVSRTATTTAVDAATPTSTTSTAVDAQVLSTSTGSSTSTITTSTVSSTASLVTSFSASSKASSTASTSRSSGTTTQTNAQVVTNTTASTSTATRSLVSDTLTTTGPIKLPVLGGGASIIAATQERTNTFTTTLTSGTTLASSFTNASSAVVEYSLLEDREMTILNIVMSGDAPAASAQVKGESMVAQELTTEAMVAAGGQLDVPVQGSGAIVSLPASFLEAVGGRGVLVVTVLDSEMALPPTQGQVWASTPGVQAVLSIRAASAASNNWVDVNDLSDPIRFTLPLTSDGSAHCAYWDEEEDRWSDKGMETLGIDKDGHLICSSVHLTLFAAILDGFTRALLCSQATLLSAKGLAAIGQGDWFFRPDTILLWIVVLLEMSLLLTAFYLDARRRRQGYWSDEHFLTSNASYLQASTMNQYKRGGTLVFAAHRAKIAAQGAGSAATSGCCASAKETAMNFLDSIGSTFHASFGQLRNFLVCAYETLCDLLVPAEDGKRSGVLRRLLARFLAASIEHQACASLWMSREDIRFLAEERKSHFADTENGSHGGCTPAKRLHSGYFGVRTPTTAWQDNFGRTSSMALEHISELHQVVGEGLDRHHSKLFEQKCMCFPTTAWTFFRSQAPWLTVLHYSIFMSASLSTLLLMCRTFGAMAVTALFFQATGAISAESSKICTEDQTLWDSLGQCIAVGLVTIVLAAIPETLFAKLHTREFKDFDAEDMPERQQQLRIWRRKDYCLWTACVAYVSFCLLFVMSFLANVTQEDALEWEFSAAVEILTELVFVPAAMSLLFLCVTSITARWKDIVEECGEHIGKAPGTGCPKSAPSQKEAAVLPAEALRLPGLLRAADTAQQTLKRSNSAGNWPLEKLGSFHSNDAGFLQ